MKKLFEVDGRTSLWWSHDMLKLFVKQIMLVPHGHEWSYQGLGMFRLYLSKAYRLHVWMPSMAVPNVSTIHSHPWHFDSCVISGKITDVLYEESGKGVIIGPQQKQKIVCGPGGCAVEAPRHAHLHKLQEVTIEEGDSYSLSADAIHESKPEEGAITLIHRTFREDTEHAYVFYPTGEKWVSAEPRPATDAEVTKMALIALSKLVTP